MRVSRGVSSRIRRPTLWRRQILPREPLLTSPELASRTISGATSSRLRVISPRRNEPMLSIAEGRTVFVYEDPWPAGMLTGYEAEGGFVLEAGVSFGAKRRLLKMLTLGLRVAGERGYGHIRVRLPLSYPKTPKLRSLAARMGMTEYHMDEEYVDCVRYL